MLSDLPETEHKKALADAGLNVPYGAWCFLTGKSASIEQQPSRLNAPYGAWCFLTGEGWYAYEIPTIRLNTPYGARCFLTPPPGSVHDDSRHRVLIHLIALGAF